MANAVTNYVLGKLVEYCEHSNKPLVVDELTTIGQLNLDSLSLIEAVFDIEEEFAVTLDGAELQGLQNVGDLIRAVNRARLIKEHLADGVANE